MRGQPHKYALCRHAGVFSAARSCRRGRLVRSLLPPSFAHLMPAWNPVLYATAIFCRNCSSVNISCPGMGWVVGCDQSSSRDVTVSVRGANVIVTSGNIPSLMSWISRLSAMTNSSTPLRYTCPPPLVSLISRCPDGFMLILLPIVQCVVLRFATVRGSLVRARH